MSKPDKSLNCSGDNFFAEIFHDKSLWRYSDACLLKMCIQTADGQGHESE